MTSANHFHLSAAAAAGEDLDNDEGLPPRCKRLKLTHAAYGVGAPFPFSAAADEFNTKPPLFPPSAPPPLHCYVRYKPSTSSEALHCHMRSHPPPSLRPGAEQEAAVPAPPVPDAEHAVEVHLPIMAGIRRQPRRPHGSGGQGVGPQA